MRDHWYETLVFIVLTTSVGVGAVLYFGSGW